MLPQIAVDLSDRLPDWFAPRAGPFRARERSPFRSGQQDAHPFNNEQRSAVVQRNAPKSNIRRGRFLSDDASGTNAITIIKPIIGTRYRVFNTGRNAFRVTWGAAAWQTMLVRRRCSCDFDATNDDITVAGQATTRIVGSYDQIDRSDRPRNGRFQFPPTTSADLDIPITRRTPGIYRIFDAHDENEFVVSLGGSGNDIVTLEPGSSIDVGVAGNQSLKIRSATPTRGSYVLLKDIDSEQAEEVDAEEDGRFGKINGSVKIIENIPDARRYRIFNSGENAFTINYGDGDITLDTGCSIDAKISTTGATVTVGKGFYERVIRIAGQRGGRCTFEAASANEKRRIIGRAPGRFYRVLNSGQQEVTVAIGAKSQTIMSDMSLDFLPSQGDDVEIEAATMGEIVETIYDPLDRRVAVRSGRFRREGFATTDRHLIIDVSQGTGNAAMYRFLNPGDKPFRIYIGDATDPVATVEPGLSVDLKIETGTNQSVSVGPTTDNDEIEGIYEYVSRAGG
jgi:hypothetical protein